MGKKQMGIVRFARIVEEELRKEGKVQTAERYRTTANSLARFLGPDTDMKLRDVTPAFIQKFEEYLADCRLCPNTTSFYMRNLRAIYNRAVRRGLCIQQSPFAAVYTGMARTEKRAVSAAVVRQIRTLDLYGYPSLELARDMFLFSFYMRGMSFVDMAYLRKTDLKSGTLVYHRCKTGQPLRIKWKEAMQKIVDKYPTPGSPYLLPFIKKSGRNERRQYLCAAHNLNRNLKIIGTMLKLDRPLTMYVARHSWASIARNCQVPLSVISEGMGHTSESTTRIYLATLDHSRIDKANDRVLALLEVGSRERQEPTPKKPARPQKSTEKMVPKIREKLMDCMKKATGFLLTFLTKEKLNSCKIKEIL